MSARWDADVKKADAFLAMVDDRNRRGKLWRSILQGHECVVVYGDDSGRLIELCLICGHESGGATPSDPLLEVDAQGIRDRWETLWRASQQTVDDTEGPYDSRSAPPRCSDPLPPLADPWPVASWPQQFRQQILINAEHRNMVAPGIWRKFQEAATAPDNEYWQELRRRVFERDKHTCQGCLDPNAQGLNCHHLTYRNLGTELAHQLITLCDDCHDKVHFRGEYKSRKPKCYNPDRLPKWSY